MHHLWQAEVADATRPTLWVTLLCCFEDLPALCQNFPCFTVVTLTRRDITKGAVPVFVVVPYDELLNPRLGLNQGGKAVGGEPRPVFHRLEGRLCKGVVVANARSAVR